MSERDTFIAGNAPDAPALTPIRKQPSDSHGPSALQICAFGSPQVRLAGVTLSFVRRKSVALLIYLAATHRTHTREELANLLWGGLPQVRAFANLRKVLGELRDQVHAALIITRETIALNPAYPVWLDAAAFDAAIDRGIAAADAGTLQAAADRYHDDFLAGFFLADADEFDEWVLLYREHLHSRLIEALQMLAQMYMHLREDRAAIVATTRLIALDPWREEAYRQLMLLLARNGERSAAIAQYEACRRVLGEELGVEPLAETTAIYRRLLIDPVPPPHTLPPVNDFFVGRDRELRYIATRLADPVCRMLTLVGLPGIGKTQLALHAARACLKRNALVEPIFPDGIYYIPLTAPPAGVDATAHVLTTIAAALGVQGSAYAPLRHLEAGLHGKTILLVLDDLDTDGGMEAASQILACCPGVKVLGTSRSWLHLPEEWTLEVGGLVLPATPAEVESSPAGALLLHHAERHGTSEELTTADLEAIGRACRAVDGHPLALILAAHWRPTLSFAMIADGVTQDFDLFDMMAPYLLKRPWSMRDAIAQSVNHLPQSERALLQRLAVFAGGFDRDAAQTVADASPLSLLALSRYSVLTCGRDGRYTVPSLVRCYLAAEPVAPDQVEVTRARHAAYYAAFVSSCACEFSEESQLWRAIEAERENVRAAWDWAVHHNQIAMLMTMHEGMIAWYEQTGRLDAWAEAFGGAVRAARRSVRDRGTHAQELGWLLLGHGRANMQRSHYAEAAIDFEEAVNLARAMGFTVLEAQSLLASEAAHAGRSASQSTGERCRDPLTCAATRARSRDALVRSAETRAVVSNSWNQVTPRSECTTACCSALWQAHERSMIGILLSNVAQGLAHCAETTPCATAHVQP